MFEKLKDKLMKRIERNAVKSYIGGEKVYLKKGGLLKEWGQIYPPVNEDGTWNIPNLVFGGKRNLIRLLIYIIVIAILGFAIIEGYGNYTALLENPCVKNCLENNIGLTFETFLPII